MSDWDDDWDNPILNDNNYQEKPRGSFFGIAAVLMIVGLIVVGIVVVSIDEKHDEIERNEQTRASIREAFDADNVGVDVELQDELDFFFSRLLEASKNRDANALQELFDAERYFQQVKNCDVISSMTPFEERDFKAAVQDRSFEAGWGDYTIIHVDPIDGSSEYVVYIHLTNADDSARDNFRFWVARSSHGWKLFDWEVIDFGMPESVEEALLFEYSLDHRSDEFISCVEDLGAAYKHLADGDSRSAIEKVRKAESRNVHPKLHDNAQLRIAYVWSHIGDWSECLKTARRISEPEKMPGYYSMQVQVYERWRHYEQAAELALQHEMLAGIDPFVLEARCSSLDQLGRLEEAVPSLQKILRWAPEDSEALQYLAQALPHDQKELLVVHLNRVADPVETAVSLAEQFVHSHEPDLLRTLAKFVEQSEPKSARTTYLQALVERAEGNFEQAADLLLQATLNEKIEEVASTYRWEYIEVMSDLGRIAGAYEALDDKLQAFQSLAEWLEIEEDETQRTRAMLRDLIAAHREQFPDDPWLHYYAGVLYALDSKFDEAEKEYLVAVESTQDEQLIADARYHRVNAYLESGRAMEAYESIGASDGTFPQIAAHLEWSKKPKELRQLISAHKAKSPDDPWLNYYEAVAFLLEEKHEQAAQIFEKAARSSEDDIVKSSSRSKLLNAKFDLQGALQAYSDLEFSEDAFQRYAYQLSTDEQWDEFDSLVRLHEQKHPDDPSLLGWKLDRLWKTHDYEAIVRQFASVIPIEVGLQRDWRSREIEERVLRSYVRLNRHSEAVRYAESRFQQDGDAERILIAHLGAGNLEQARKAFALYNQSAYSSASIYSDEDVGSRLFEEKFRSLREEFPPPLYYNPFSGLAVLFFDELPAWDTNELRVLLTEFGVQDVEIQPLNSIPHPTTFRFRSQNVSFVLTLSDSNYKRTEIGDLDVQELKDPKLQALLDGHRGWLSLHVETGRRIEPTDDELSLGYKLVTHLLSDSCRGVYLENVSRLVLNSPSVEMALTSISPEIELQKLGDYVWLYREEALDPEEALEIQRCQTRLHRFAKAFASRTPEQEFAVQIKLSSDFANELHWINVNRIREKSYRSYEIIGNCLSDSQIFREFSRGEPVVVQEYEVQDWKYGVGDATIQGRVFTSK